MEKIIVLIILTYVLPAIITYRWIAVSKSLIGCDYGKESTWSDILIPLIPVFNIITAISGFSLDSNFSAYNEDYNKYRRSKRNRIPKSIFEPKEEIFTGEGNGKYPLTITVSGHINSGKTAVRNEIINFLLKNNIPFKTDDTDGDLNLGLEKNTKRWEAVKSKIRMVEVKEEVFNQNTPYGK
jgi:hypothetical protein